MTKRIDWKTERAGDSGTLVRVEPQEGGGWFVIDERGMGFFVENTHCQTVPKVGETYVLVGEFGYPIRGIEIADRCYCYRTQAQEEARHRAEVLDAQNKRQQEADAQVAERDAKVAAMPEFFRKRIERFRKVTPDFRRDHEPYEIFTCEQAVLFAEKLQTPEALSAFSQASCDEQRRLVPGLSREHSGNTFGMALKLAHISLKEPELLPKMHGALCALVGCKEYGCYAAREARTES